MRNPYGELVEQWKVDLIVARARRQGVRRADLDDILQEVILAVIAFKYDKQKANGATETTALTALVDRKIAFIRRGESRTREREKEYCGVKGFRGVRRVEDISTPSDEEGRSLALDVRAGCDILNPVEREICLAKSLGEPECLIADKLGISRYELDRIIDNIRERFRNWGLGEWEQT
jgi:DNA-directed RNA polymerase specialized sigma24 family protein